MKDFNITRLMNASPFINQIDKRTYDALFDYYNNNGMTLDNINVDNDIVNGITESTIEEFKNNYESFDEVYILVLNEGNNFISYFNN